MAREPDQIVRIAASGEQPDSVVGVVGDQVLTATPADVGKVVTVAADGSLVFAAGGGGGGVTDHGGLTGLGDDDHPQYADDGHTHSGTYVALAGSTSTGEQVAPSFQASGKAGATATPITLAGGTAAGAPASGTHVKGELVADDAGAIWYCTVAGTPGTWVQANSATYVAMAQAVNDQTGTTYTLVAGDAGKLVTLSNASAITLTLPQDSDATIAIGTYVDLYALGAGQVTTAAGTGATLRVSGLTAKSRAQYARFGVQKVSANTWVLFGDLAAS